MRTDDKNNLDKLILVKKSLEKSLKATEEKIKLIKHQCQHKNNYIADNYKQHGKGKSMIDRCCRDCGYYWTTEA